MVRFRDYLIVTTESNDRLRSKRLVLAGREVA